MPTIQFLGKHVEDTQNGQYLPTPRCSVLRWFLPDLNLGYEGDTLDSLYHLADRPRFTRLRSAMATVPSCRVLPPEEDERNPQKREMTPSRTRSLHCRLPRASAAEISSQDQAQLCAAYYGGLRASVPGLRRTLPAPGAFATLQLSGPVISVLGAKLGLQYRLPRDLHGSKASGISGARYDVLGDRLTVDVVRFAAVLKAETPDV
ncbi:hypothetical protein DL770_007097 [Monosporascus sp. CRB-9-2]|nr:hypothetical protein DL770_007097 [Monosporascus sp. CRB-9-2]